MNNNNNNNRGHHDTDEDEDEDDDEDDEDDEDDTDYLFEAMVPASRRKVSSAEARMPKERPPPMVGGACAIIVQTMRAFPQDRSVQDVSCRALTNLTVDHCSGGGAASLHDAEKEEVPADGAAGPTGASPTTSTTTAIKPGDSSSSSSGGGSGGGGGGGSGGNASRRCGEAGACGAVVAAMRRFHTDRQLLCSGLKALVNLTCGDELNRARFGDVGAARVVVGVLLDFPKDEDLQLTGCVAVDNLARDAENKMRLQEVDALGIVVDAMRSFPFRRDLQFQASRALYFLGPIFDGNAGGSAAAASSSSFQPAAAHAVVALTSSSPRSADARAALRAAILAFPNDDELREEATDALLLGMVESSYNGIGGVGNPAFSAVVDADAIRTRH